MSLTFSDDEVDDLRVHLQIVAKIVRLDGVHTSLASWAMEWLPKLAHRAHALEKGREERRALKGESPTAREKRIRRETSERDAGCSAVGFAGVSCSGRLEWHHVHGRGEGRPPASTENTEWLCWLHHLAATNNDPSRLAWLERHLERAWRFGYEDEAAYTEGLIALEKAQHPEPTP